MRLIVTGSSGFVGRHLVAALEAAGHDGLAVSRHYAAGQAGAWTTATRGAVLNQKTASCDVLVHLEVMQHVPHPTARDLAAFEAVNVGGTKEWLDWAGRQGVRRFVHFSTIKAVNAAPVGATDESAAGPHPTPYGASKWRAEALVRDWVREDPARSALILRPAVVYGPGNRANVAAMVAAIRRGRFFLIGRNENVKSLVSVGNLAAAVVHLLPRFTPGAAETYNVTDAESVSVRELDRRIRALLGKPGNSPSLPYPAARVLAGVGDLVFRVTGRPFPLNSSRLAALLETTHFSCARLCATGFRHPETDLGPLVRGAGPLRS